MPPLATQTWGDGPVLVLLHGFTQNASCWGPLGSHLGRSHTVVAVDLPGHGGSATVDADLDETAALVLEVVGSDRFDLFGYSLGGRVALTTALAAPERIDHLVLLGATAGIDDPEAAAERRRSDEALATAIEREDDLPAFLRRWLDQDLFRDLDDDQAQLAARCRNTVGGLTRSLRRAGAGTQDPSWERLARLDIPTLVIAGQEDAKFRAIAERMVELLPDGELAVVEGAGHACHLTRPDAVGRLVDGWLG